MRPRICNPLDKWRPSVVLGAASVFHDVSIKQGSDIIEHSFDGGVLVSGASVWSEKACG